MEDEDQYRGVQRVASKTTSGPKSLAMCTSGAHCINGCDCIDRACVNIMKFHEAIKDCQTCNSTSDTGDACAGDGDSSKCLPSIGFCDVCSSAAVKAGLDSCIPATPSTEGPDANADIVIAMGTNGGTGGGNGDIPAGTEEPPVAVPPGASVNPEEVGDGNGDGNGTGNGNGGTRDVDTGDENGNDTDTDNIAPTDAEEVAILDSLDDGSLEGLLLPSIEPDEGACVSISWLRTYGHMQGVLHNDNSYFHTANVLCLPLEYNLPCGTPGHLLLRRSDGMMLSYESVCNNKGSGISCVRTRMVVGRLRAAYEWSKVSSMGVQLTPFSVGESRISHVIALAAAHIAEVGYGYGGPLIIDEISRAVVKFQQVSRLLGRRGRATTAFVSGTRR